MPYTFTCQKCGKPFTSPYRDAKYCSRHCYYAARWHTTPHPPTAVTLTCAVCGRPFQCPRYQVAQGRKYCSLSCQRKGRAPLVAAKLCRKVTKVCGVCHKSYTVLRSQAKGSHYCSVACKNTGFVGRFVGDKSPHWVRRITCVCQNCGKEYGLVPCLASRNQFCSRACAATWQMKHMHHPTSIEVAIARLLTSKSISYQQEQVVGKYLCDFLLPDHALIIECDGLYWHSSAKTRHKDKERDAWLLAHGYSVLRLPEDKIKVDQDWCWQQIERALSSVVSG